MPPDLLALLGAQAGVVSRRQVLGVGLDDKDVDRLIRRRLLTRVHPGVYLDHTGQPTWEQRCWAAVLAMAPAALAGATACRMAEGRDTRRAAGEVDVVVPWARRRVAPAGVSVRRRREFAEHLHPGSGVPRLRYEQAVIDLVAAARDEVGRVAELSLAVNSRRTSPARLLSAVDGRARVPDRAGLRALIGDAAAGTCSVLEHGFTHLVERAHGLPVTVRQARGTVREHAVYRDALSKHGICIELDGRLHERREQRERDFDRDLAAAADELVTVRLSYGQVFTRPCWTAARLADLYRARGWGGDVAACGAECPLR